jgi:hypothetical protein
MRAARSEMAGRSPFSQGTNVNQTLEAFEDAAVGDIAADERAVRTPLWRRLLFGAFVTVAVLFFLAAVLYRFGSMWVPSSEVQSEYNRLVASGAAEPLDARFHVPIPGCVCHSDDPVLTMQHSNRRISECSGCH